MEIMLHTDGIPKVSQQQEFACRVIQISSLWKNIYFLCIDIASPQYESVHVCLSKYSLKTLFHTSDMLWLFPSMSALMPV